MVVPKVICVMMTFLLSRMFFEAASEQCGSEYSIFGMMLKRHIFKTIRTSISFECLQACNEDDRCHSFNYVISQDLCELNNRTKEARPEDFVPNLERYYLRRHKTRVPLGSIQLPAGSCKEIKGSEGGQAVSGQYLFDSIIHGKVVQAHCDMETEDMDECNSSIPVCDVNATCQNTIGSYKCTCKAGLTGDGKSICSDVDECIQGSHDCLPEHASCTNTEGSYSCACNHGYTGDGKTNCDPPDCQNYETLIDADRKITHALVGSAKCDRPIATAWYRFQGDAGTRMPTSCPPIRMCQTHATGWLNGVHPTVADGSVTRQVCFHYSSSCCNWSTDIKVRNCGSYYIYYLSDTPTCSLRFCGTG